MSAEGDRSGLSRWAKRKAEARGPKRGRAAPVAVEDIEDLPVDTIEEAPRTEGAPLIVAEPETVAQEDDLTEEEREAMIAELPDLESLDKDSDYTPFLQKGVPQDLMKAALRRLWLSDTIFANLDGMNEYDENYNLIDRAITLADTNYLVGRGFMRDEDDDKPEDALADAEGEEVAEANETGGEPEEGDEQAAKTGESSDEADLAGAEKQPVEEDDEDENPELG